MREVAKETVFSCGHKGIVMVHGNSKQKAEMVEWKSANMVCPECYKEEKEREKKEKINTMNAPELEGSEKQIAWANSIRNEFILAMDARIKKTETDMKGIPFEKKCAERMLKKLKCNTIEELKEVVKNILQRENQAVYWIDTRDVFSEKRILKEMEEIE